MMSKIIRELIIVKNTNENPSVQVLSWVRRVDGQRAQKAILDVAKKTKSVML